MQRKTIIAILHDSFEISLGIKALLAIPETIAGLILFFVGPDTIVDFLANFSQERLSSGAHDYIFNTLLGWSEQFSLSAQMFISFYLLSHGIIKLFVIGSLWKEKRWAFPVGITFFFLFIAYQMYEYFFNHSLWLIILSVFDIVVIYLTWNEYQRVKTKIAF